MKLYDIALAAKPLQKLIEQDLPLRQAYQLAMLATRLNPTLEFYGNQLMSGRPQAELNELDAQMEALYEKLPDCDNMPLYEKALEKADPKVLDEIDTLEQEYDRVCEKHADLWDKVDEAYFNLPDDYDFDNYDEAAFIRSLTFLTDAEKDALIADYNRLTEIDSRLCELYDSIWGNTGCESGICPL